MKIEAIKPRMIPLGSTERLRPLHWSEIGTLPRRDYLIKGLLDKGGLSVTFGPSNSGKSFFSLDMAICIARGIQWRGKRTRQGAVVYVAAEGGLGLVERMKAYSLRHEISVEDIPLYIIAASVDLFGSEDADVILRHIEEMGIEPVAICVDTLAASFGAGNENTTQDMNQYVGNVQRLRIGTGAHCLIVHHSGKDESRGSRGAYSLTAATDTELEVFADDSGNRTVSVKKQRDGIIGVGFNFRLDVVDLGEDEDGDHQTSCVVVEAEEGASRKKGKTGLSPKAKRGLEALQEVMVELGRKAPESIHYPAGIQVVEIAEWRDMMQRRGVLSDDANTARTQYSRVHTVLSDNELVAEYGGKIWIIPA